METSSSETAPGAEYSVARRLLATLEVVTAVLVALALLVHALRKRMLDARARTHMDLKGSVVLITSDSPFSRELSSEFEGRGCTVARLVNPGRLKDEPATDSQASSTITFECTCITKADARALVDEVRERLGQPIDVLALVNDDENPSSDGLHQMDELVNKQLMRTCYLLESLVPLMRSGGRVLSVAREGGAYTGGRRASHFSRARRSFAELLHTLTHQFADHRGDIHVTSARLRGGARAWGVEGLGGVEGVEVIEGLAGLVVSALCAGARDITLPTARQHYTFKIKGAVQKTHQSICKAAAVWRRRKIMA